MTLYYKYLVSPRSRIDNLSLLRNIAKADVCSYGGCDYGADEQIFQDVIPEVRPEGKRKQDGGDSGNDIRRAACRPLKAILSMILRTIAPLLFRIG